MYIKVRVQRTPAYAEKYYYTSRPSASPKFANSWTKYLTKLPMVSKYEIFPGGTLPLESANLGVIGLTTGL
jgi:hypothetical protein